jgi:hypothetical protein
LGGIDSLDGDWNKWAAIDYLDLGKGMASDLELRDLSFVEADNANR